MQSTSGLASFLRLSCNVCAEVDPHACYTFSPGAYIDIDANSVFFLLIKSCYANVFMLWQDEYIVPSNFFFCVIIIAFLGYLVRDLFRDFVSNVPYTWSTVTSIM